MVWYPYRRYYWRRRRPNWITPWRTRRSFRRRRYKHRRVRAKFKLPSIPIRQWQPKSIRYCHIKGLECLCLFNQARLSFNSVMYKESFVPEGYPGGGGFSVMKFTLQNLYEMHQKCYNWWTQSNEDLPLCRYLGCKLKFYSSENFDYIVKYDNTLPATSNKLTYPSTQPSMLLMSSHKKIIPSRKTNPKRKPYTIVKVKPPAKLENKWYFQKEFREIPLVVLYTAPTNLKQFYINSQKENNNITINSINTSLITNRDFKLAIWPFKIDGTTTLYMWEYVGDEPEGEELCKYMIPLTNIRQFTQGGCYKDIHPTSDTRENIIQYCTRIQQYTGNPFVPEHREGKLGGRFYSSKTGPQTFATWWKANPEIQKKVSDVVDNGGKMQITRIHDPLVEKYRYNPFRDTGQRTQMYLLKCSESTQARTAWDPPDNPDIILNGFPLWLNIWGYIDFQIKLGAIQSIEGNTMLVFKTDALKPNTNKPIVVIDSDYLNGKSPYQDKVSKEDSNNWWPSVQYQTEQINLIAQTGPGTTKLYDKTSEQIVVKYDFRFKWGGEPAKMINVENPSKQIRYPLPSDEFKQPSLQSPAQAYETLLYSFDQRYDQLTKQALNRITKDWDVTDIVSPITEPTGAVPVLPTYPQATQETETEKKEKEALLLQLINQRQQQQQLRLRIVDLMKQMDL
nr:MAG: ORF1 [TTV-like mini virus]UGV37019.1 MAG: ORF1 [TTV-like mini virus]UGV37671.1 MAG: ORF1 [TTV-like mini virus]UGV39023.1 MAG: ORF1 [TTV-like mini virus]